jgi:hypothetical protein
MLLSDPHSGAEPNVTVETPLYTPSYRLAREPTTSAVEGGEQADCVATIVAAQNIAMKPRVTISPD